MRAFILSAFIVTLLVTYAYPQVPKHYNQFKFTNADTLRGQLRPERTCYDVKYYELNIKVDPSKKYISGHVKISYNAVRSFTRIQVDLYRDMKINKILHRGVELEYERKHDAVFITFDKIQKANKLGRISIYYEGKPTTSPKPPWQGGFVWRKDKNGNPWIGVACEGAGASLWWPNKDHLSDEPDSMLISCSVPEGLSCVSNGNLRSFEAQDSGWVSYNWFVSYPINNYNVSINIADYVHFSDTFVSQIDGESMPLDYYVLRQNYDKAVLQFKQVEPTLKCFEHYFGKYPFWDDGFALVEVPYLGMEHQSAIAYGNKYKNGYLGAGGMNRNGIHYDYIIVHETAHEYFGNSLSVNDHAEMWINEAFATYLEALMVEYHHGFDKSVWYMQSLLQYIENKEPMLGPLDVNWDDWVASDHYYKGAWMLHTLRSVIDDDKLWFKTIKEFYMEHEMSHINTREAIKFFNKKTGLNLNKFFEQYLEYSNPPKLLVKFRYTFSGVKISYKWKTEVKGFDMPVTLGSKDEMIRVYPSTEKWQTISLPKMKSKDFKVGTDLFYIHYERK